MIIHDANAGTLHSECIHKLLDE